MTTPSMIAIDWGSTSARAWLLNEQGMSIGMFSAMLGVKKIPMNGFDDALQQLCGAWLSKHTDLPVLASGMIGSNQGWREAPYVACPVDESSLARETIVVETLNGHQVHIVPGVRYTDPNGLHDVMRGEETQVFGVLSTDADDDKLLILPGTHSKWVRVENRKVNWFTTFITGELFDVLTTHSLLIQPNHNDDAVVSPINFSSPEFLRGVEHALTARADGAGMLSRLFSVRTRRLIDGVAGAESKKYLSGLLIGSEISEALGILKRQGIPLQRATLVGDPDLCALYRSCLTRCGVVCDIYGSPAAVQGLWSIANHSSIVERRSHA
jgi:2-dehydro-3-deoxygalactonokinase